MSKNKRLQKIEIMFDEPVLVSGTPTEKLTMRRQKVQDALDAEVLAGGGSVAGQEVALFSVLCGVPMEDLKEFDVTEYRKLQEGYLFLVEGAAKGQTPPAGVKPCASQAGQAGA